MSPKARKNSAAAAALAVAFIAVFAGISASCGTDEKDIVSLTINPGDVTLTAGERIPTTAVGITVDGAPLVVNDRLEWTSTAPSVAQVSMDERAPGHLAALSEGTALLQATDNVSGVTAELKVTVLKDPRSDRSVAGPTAAPCSAEKIAEVLAPATEDVNSVSLTCSLSFDDKERVITKRILIDGSAGSGVLLSCGAKTRLSPASGTKGLAVRSVLLKNGTWSRPENVTVRGCTIDGGVTVSGMSNNSTLPYFRSSSFDVGHTERAQAAAPKRILLDRLKINTTGTIPLYVFPGSTYVTLQNSEIRGWGESTAIYLDAETGWNTIQGNTILMDGKVREQIAVDGSAYNWIAGNHFSALNRGGIYLYRNCGETGTVRHQPPTHNWIIGNYFYYDEYDGDNPAIWVGQRQGNRNYCHLDSAHPVGSGLSDLDFATDNVIGLNSFRNLSPETAIRLDDGPNFLFGNRTSD